MCDWLSDPIVELLFRVDTKRKKPVIPSMPVVWRGNPEESTGLSKGYSSVSEVSGRIKHIQFVPVSAVVSVGSSVLLSNVTKDSPSVLR